MPGPSELRLWTALATGAVAGAVCLWAFGKLTRQEELRRSRNRIQARVMELRLYRDEPGVIIRAMGAVFAGNFRLTAALLKPVAILAVPLVLLSIQLDGLLGLEALPLNRPALVTVQLADSQQSVQLTAPPAIQVEASVDIPRLRQRVWRIRPTAPVAGVLELHCEGATVTKTVVAQDRFAFLAPVRRRSLLGLLDSPFEARLPAGVSERIEIGYPGAVLPLLGLEWNWLVWFVLASLPAALLAKALFHIQL